jgi:5-(carboxyamino)imidazole ribonucleotide synthase
MMTTLGILGGGQLGRMLALAAAPLGVRCRAWDPSSDACAGHVCELVTAAWDDSAALERFCDGLDAVTCEFENVPVDLLHAVSERTMVAPGPRSFSVASDRLDEKQFLEAQGVPVAPYRTVDDAASLRSAVAELGLPAVLKTRRFGYDGKGQTVLRGEADVERIAAEVDDHRPRILEGLVEFDCELSTVAVRAHSGEVRCFPLVRNVHRGGILCETTAPAGVDDGLERSARERAERVLHALDHVGVLTIEWFLRGDELIGNEIAPRVHNSGHWSIDGAFSSQFEQHVRAVMDMPLGRSEVRTPSVMFNMVGGRPPRDALLEIGVARVHDYAKEARPGRKIGHVTCLRVDGAAKEAVDRVRGLVDAAWRGNEP